MYINKLSLNLSLIFLRTIKKYKALSPQRYSGAGEIKFHRLIIIFQIRNRNLGYIRRVDAGQLRKKCIDNSISPTSKEIKDSLTILERTISESQHCRSAIGVNKHLPFEAVHLLLPQ